MTDKLALSLDEILEKELEQKSRRRASKIRKSAPSAGIQKSSRRAVTAKPLRSKPAPISSESSIVVNNLPYDVEESQIKDYFNESVSRVKSVEISYGPNGTSRGKANVTFYRHDGASKAFKNLNGILVDNRPIEIQIVVGEDKAASILQEAKSLFQRTSGHRAQPKSAASDRRNPVSRSKFEKDRGGNRRPRSGRPVKKTLQQLDSEMADYFDSANGNNDTGGQRQSHAEGDAPMEDEIS